MFSSILIAIISIIVLLSLHEFGHFIVAKKCGFRVEEFGIGYPPRLWGKKFGGTLYSINLIPFGAHVRIPEAEGEESRNKPRWKRMLVLLGGVVSFWIIAFILLTAVFKMGAPQAVSDEEAGLLVDPKVQVLAVLPDSPAGEAGLRSGDVIKEFSIGDSRFSINKIKEVQDLTQEYKGGEVGLTIERGKEVIAVSLVPRVSYPEDEGPMGVSLVRTAEKSYSWLQAPLKGAEATWNLTYGVVAGWGSIISGLLQGKGLPKGVQFVGPVGIGALISQAAQVGINYFLQFIAMISVYLAIFNLLPIPALDGGKLLFLAIEKIKGGAINRRAEENVTVTFFLLLIILMIWVTIKDIGRLF